MSDIPKVVDTRIIEAGKFGEIPVHILDDGRKVIDEDIMQRFITYLEGGGELTKEIVDELDTVIRSIR